MIALLALTGLVWTMWNRKSKGAFVLMLIVLVGIVIEELL